MSEGLVRLLAPSLMAMCVASPAAPVADAQGSAVSQAIEAAEIVRRNDTPEGTYFKSAMLARRFTSRAAPRSREVMDAIADTLTTIAIQDARAPVRKAATLVLVHAVLGVDGVPYEGAAARLCRIVLEGPDLGGGIVATLANVPTKANGIPCLRTIATSSRSSAWAAVAALARDTGPEGEAVARELYVGDLVIERVAREIIGRFASTRGWRRP